MKKAPPPRIAITTIIETTTIGVLVDVPVMLFLVYIANKSVKWYKGELV